MLSSVLILSVVGHLVFVDASGPYEDDVFLRVSSDTIVQEEWLHQLQANGTLRFWSRNVISVTADRAASLKNEMIIMHILWEALDRKQKKTHNYDNSNRLNTTPYISFNKYNRYDEIAQYLVQLEAVYPHLVEVQSIGISTEGRPIPVIKISRGGKKGHSEHPMVLIDAGMHAREWIGPAMALYIIHQLVVNKTNEDLLANADWHVIPVLNTDGYEYTHTTDRHWRKTRSCQPCFNDSDPFQGVDINRNFDFHWMGPGSSNLSCSLVYAGPVPFSEPETRGLRDYALAHAARIKLYFSLHSPGEDFLHPWAWTSTLPSDNEELDDLAKAANAAQVAAGGDSFDVGASSVIYGELRCDDWGGVSRTSGKV